MEMIGSAMPDSIVAGRQTPRGFSNGTPIPVSVESYHADEFCMSSKDDRDRYCTMMLDLYGKVNAGSAVIWRNELAVLSASDGSTSWHRYIEWSDYKVDMG